MKSQILTTLAALASAGFALGQATTNPVGYVSLGDDTVGQPAIKASTDVYVSIPLHRPTEYSGTVASTTASSITVSGTPAWTTSPLQWAPDANTPYLVTVTSGAEDGFTGLITSNTADTLNVTPVTGGSLINVLSTDTVIIYKAWTLITLFPPGTFSPGVRVFAWSGTAAGTNIAADLNYLWNGTNFTKSSVISNNTIFYAGESFMIRTLSTPVTTLTLSGEVPTFNSRTYIDKITAGVAQDTRVSYISPVDEVIGDSGLSGRLTAGDRLFAFNNNQAGTNKAANENLLWNGTNWTLSGTPVTTSYTLKGGRGYMIRRLATAPVGTSDWSDKPSYQP